MVPFLIAGHIIIVNLYLVINNILVHEIASWTSRELNHWDGKLRRYLQQHHHGNSP